MSQGHLYFIPTPISPLSIQSNPTQKYHTLNNTLYARVLLLVVFFPRINETESFQKLFFLFDWM